MKQVILKENNDLIKTNSLDVNDLIQRYLNYIDVSDNSNKTYYNALKQFARYLYQNDIKQPTREQIIQYRDSLLNYLKPNTINLYLVAIKNFYNWLEYENISKNITKNIKSLRIGKEHIRQSLTEEQCKLALNSTKDMREKVLLLLGITLGLRCNEIANIRLEDFKIKQDKICLYVLGKGRDYKQDFVIVPNNVYNIIIKYVKEYNINDYLFISTSNNCTNKQLSTVSIRKIVKNVLKRIGLDSEEYVLHSLRHTFATLSLLNGSNIREVSQSMRHSSTATTEIYLHDLEELNNKCSNNVSNLFC